MRVVIDSSFFVSLFLDKDQHHTKSKEIFKDLVFKENEKFTSYLALPEIVGVIRRITADIHLAHLAEETLKAWMEGMIDFKELTNDRIFSATETAVRYGIRGADSIFVSLALETDSHFLTFDEKLKDRLKGVKLFKA